MQLTFFNIIALFLAGALTAMSGGIIVGLLVYKTKYAGGELFKGKDDFGGAEAFNLDKEFIESDDPEDYKPIEYPPEIEKSVADFEKAFGMQRLIDAAKTTNLEEQDAA